MPSRRAPKGQQRVGQDGPARIVALRMSDATIRQLDDLAARNHLTFSDLTRRLIKRGYRALQEDARKGAR